MASAYQKRGTWYVAYKDASGKRRCEKSAAATKTEAKRLAFEEERHQERVRRGVDEPTTRETVDELIEWWILTYLSKTVAYKKIVGSVRKHLVGSELGGLRLGDVRSGHVEAFLQQRSGSVSARTLNHIRGYLCAAFNCARRSGRFVAINPVSEVHKRKVPRAVPDYLKLDEVPRVVEVVPSHWRPVFVAALYSGMRKGEIFGLRKSDVDLVSRLLTVARSYDRETTKGGHGDVIPIAEELVPHLAAAMAASPSELVFPRPDGRMQHEHVQLEQVLRSALRRAGIVTGYRHSCRRKGCGYKEAAQDGTLRRCPKCNMKLWPHGLVRPLRFHHLRHSTASLLMMAGANPAAVQRILRHSDPRITTEVYGHLAPEYLRSEMNLLALGVAAPKTRSRGRDVDTLEVAGSVAAGDDDGDGPESGSARVENSSRNGATGCKGRTDGSCGSPLVATTCEGLLPAAIAETEFGTRMSPVRIRPPRPPLSPSGARAG